MDAILEFISQYKVPACAMTILTIGLFIKKKWGAAFAILTGMFGTLTFLCMSHPAEPGVAPADDPYVTGFTISFFLTSLCLLAAAVAHHDPDKVKNRT